jgi:hypothetical protein
VKLYGEWWERWSHELIPVSMREARKGEHFQEEKGLLSGGSVFAHAGLLLGDIFRTSYIAV